MTQTQPTTTDHTTIYRHDTRSDWGDAILAWEREGKRGYQFEDGKLRVFKGEWCQRLQEVDQPLAKAALTAERLQRKLGLTPWRAANASANTISFDDQVLLFNHFYPAGFDGDDWMKEKRGAGCKTRLKRHRNVAVAEARDLLAAERLDALIATERFDEAWDTVVGVLSRTDLVTKRYLTPLENLDSHARRELTICTRELLWGEQDYAVRFERFVDALALAINNRPTWRVATALSALVHPETHVCIRPAIARAQAAWMAPRLSWSNAPSGPLYMRLRDMVKATMKELVEAGLTPRDLLDVYDFMWTTLRPKARQSLDEAKAAPAITKLAA